MRRLPSGTFGAVVTSPPYNIGNSTGGPTKRRITHGYANYDDCMPRDEYDAWQNECLRECFRLVDDEGVVFYNHKFRTVHGEMLRHDAILEGLPVRQMLVWRTGPGPNWNRSYFRPAYEVIYLICGPRCKMTMRGANTESVIDIPLARLPWHPAAFPEKLAETLLAAIGRGPVLDPFAGSGTVPLVAERMGFEWQACDISREYVDRANERIRAARKTDLDRFR